MEVYPVVRGALLGMFTALCVSAVKNFTARCARGAEVAEKNSLFSPLGKKESILCVLCVSAVNHFFPASLR